MHRRPGGLSSALTFAAVGAGAAVVLVGAAMWLAHFGKSASDQDWHRLSDIGQAFGVVSAAISAAALAAVALSLNIQRRQAGVAQMEAVFALRSQLLQFAVDRPEHLPVWGHDLADGVENVRGNAYASMVFSYLRMAYALGQLSRPELVGYCRAAFRQERVVAFWAQARRTYLDDRSSTAAREFAHLVDAEFQARAPVTADGPARPRPSAAPAPTTGLAVVGAALLIYAAVTALRRTSAARARIPGRR